MKFHHLHTSSWVLQLISCLSAATASVQISQLDSNQEGNSSSADHVSSHSKMPPNSSRQLENSTWRTLHRHVSFVINNKEICHKDTFAVIMVFSSAENFEQRTAIRETWGTVSQNTANRTKVIFLLGSPNHEQLYPNREHIKDRIDKEYHIYGDVIQASFEDSYRNLSLKSVAMLKWMNAYCQIAKFLLKTDDDVFINTKVLLQDLHNSVHSRFIMGNIIAAAQPIQDRTSKWYTPKNVYSEQMYPKYISGTAYVISGDLISDLFKVTMETDLFLWEDIFITGICAKKLDAKHIFNAKFGFKKRISDPCLFRILITGHRMMPDEQRNLWNRMNDSSLICPYPVKNWSSESNKV